MVRELLGNIRGPRGLEGPKGDDGGFNGETIGVNNLIDLSELKPYDSASTIEVDVENGIINYSNAAYYIRQTRHLNKGVHSFAIKDYTPNPGAYGGRIRFEVNDPSTNVRAVNYDTEKGEVVVFDIPESRVYQVNIRVSGVDRVNGFLEKPMLVEGEYPVSWNKGKNDISLTKDFLSGRLLPDTMVAGSNTALNVVALNSDGIESNADHIILTPGTYSFTSRSALSFGSADGTLHVSIFINGNRVARFRNNANMTLQTSHMFKASDGDTLSFQYYYDGTVGGSTEFQIDDRNGFTIVKL